MILGRTEINILALKSMPFPLPPHPQHTHTHTTSLSPVGEVMLLDHRIEREFGHSVGLGSFLMSWVMAWGHS